jgi:hypothetical protein
MLNYAIAGAALQLCGWRTGHWGYPGRSKRVKLVVSLAMQARINPQEIATLLRNRAGGFVIRRCGGTG